jgi:hypothetical protein
MLTCLERPEAQPSPFMYVPFDRDDDFVGREELLEQLTKRAALSRRVALVGIGGVG